MCMLWETVQHLLQIHSLKQLRQATLTATVVDDVDADDADVVVDVDVVDVDGC